MADYRRFISYMYLYENGRKTVNSGFVRVESRKGQCRIHVHMTGLYVPEGEDYEVFMLIRETGGYIGIAAGKLGIGQQVGELDMSTDSNHLENTDYSLDRVSGMVVRSNSGRLYGTRWDDEPLETECFVSGKQLSDRLTLFSAERREKKDSPVIPVMETTDDDSLTEMQKDLKKTDEASMENREDILPDHEEAVTDNTETMDNGDSGKKSEVRGEQMNTYEVLLQKLPQMYPFDDNSIEICVRMDLQDIGMLPMQCWLYGSNSFLLHGYYCYRHLILARTHIHRMTAEGEQEEITYILGVPGTWQHREQYMASMFGFGNFKPVSRENMGSGAFGYWFVNLK